MRKTCGALICSVLWLIQPAVSSFAQPPEFLSDLNATSFEGQTKRFGQFYLSPDVDVTSDGFGGYFYSYKDKRGNKTTTNSIDFLPEELLRAEKPVVVAYRDGATEMPLRLSESKATDNAVSTPSAHDESGEFEGEIFDPIEPVNRAFFHFNDKLYFWVIKPIATGYKKVFPEPLRVSVRNFFHNIFMPARAVNCLLQGKIKGFGTEITRFVVNSTMGVCGFGDAAKTAFNIDKRDEDFGQTLGFYGLGPGIYIHWPLLGPSSIRDTVGIVGDGFLNPVNYVEPFKYSVAIKGYDQINKTSLILGQYEALKKAAFDPYISLREAYYENRCYKIRK
ncbi:MAG: VacJ family lipoprotein [Deltaproteobacteria bacterium]|nr:VacJ family lipoprotein [Deltaproteobacteria bacterium]